MSIEVKRMSNHFGDGSCSGLSNDTNKTSG